MASLHLLLRPPTAGAVLGAVLFAAAAAVAVPARAQEVIPASPVVGTWVVAVTVEGATPLKLPNLVTFSADRTMTVAAPPVLPEVPGAAATAHFSVGQGAWTPSGGNGADFVFAFLVSGEDGTLKSINTVHGAVEVDPNAGVYIGQFKLDIVRGDGTSETASGTWQGARMDGRSVRAIGVAQTGIITSPRREAPTGRGFLPVVDRPGFF